jgi:hypothetical protein
LRGRWVIAVQGAFLGTETEGAELLRPMRQVAPGLLDSFAMMPYSRIDTIANDPLDPTASVLHSEVIREITPEMIDQVLGGIRPNLSVSLAMVEMRHLGGALARTPENGSAVGRPDGLFWFNALAVYRTAAESTLAGHEIARVREAVQPFTTGRVFLNGLGGTAAAARVSSAYSPENYRRLITAVKCIISIRRKYDPGNLFRFNRNIPPAKAS